MSKNFKDKEEGEFSMNKHIQTYQGEDVPVNKEKEEEFAEMNWSLELKESIDKYNNSIFDLNKLYTDLETREKVLVRVFLNPLKIENDIVIPNIEEIPIRTRAGHGNHNLVENPYPYSLKAVVVVTPPFVKDIKEGDLVLLSNKQVQGVSIGASNDAIITIPNKFTHPNYNNPQPPVDPTNEHYGYLLVDSREIQIKMKK